MEYRVLARKYRPQTFSDLKGQETLVKTLTNALNQGRVAHAFILTGVRGVGKTTTARIIAKGLNCIGPDGTGGATVEPCGVCENCLAIIEDRHVDVIEMDAASRTGVDDIREIIDGVRYKPVVARNKVYIIDEVHMLSRNAFNALLKTLEEPPENVRFIFATTEIRKVPVTVLSRCQRFDLKRLNAEELVSLFTEICRKQDMNAEAEALDIVARAADGSARDGLSLLDQSMSLSSGSITASAVREMLGLSDRINIFDLFEEFMGGKVSEALVRLSNMKELGAEPLSIVQDLLETVHIVTKYKVSPTVIEDTISDVEKQKSIDFAGRLPMVQLGRCWQMLLKGVSEVQYAPSPFAALEMLIIRLAYLAETPGTPESIRMLVEEKKKPEVILEGALEPETRQKISGTEVCLDGEQVVNDLPSSFIEIVDLFERKKEGIIHAELVGKVRPVRVAPGILEISVADGLDSAFLSRVSDLLSEWTGISWNVSLAEGQGDKTLVEQQRDQERQTKKEAAGDPVVSAVLTNFPGAKIESVRRLIGRDEPEVELES
tara:strand:- start:2359 stop:3999 length:1641 start_codon:yes stop_codon:yes gene_type:complete